MSEFYEGIVTVGHMELVSSGFHAIREISPSGLVSTMGGNPVSGFVNGYNKTSIGMKSFADF